MCGSTGRESCRSQFDSLPLHEWESSRKGGEYDIRSVMHYGKFFDFTFLVGISNWCCHLMALTDLAEDTKEAHSISAFLKKTPFQIQCTLDVQ